DAKQAGLELPQGFKFASDPPANGLPPPRAPVTVIDSSTGPDQLFFYYADPTTQAKVMPPFGPLGSPPSIVVDQAAGFAVTDLVVLSTVSTATNPLGGADIAVYDACVLRI